MNNKGFAMSIMLYAMSLLIISIMFLLLSFEKYQYKIGTSYVHDVSGILATNGDGEKPQVFFNLAGGFYTGNSLNLDIYYSDNIKLKEGKYYVVRLSDRYRVTSGSISPGKTATANIGMNTPGAYRIYVYAMDTGGNEVDRLPQEVYDNRRCYYQDFVFGSGTSACKNWSTESVYVPSDDCNASGTSLDFKYVTCSNIKYKYVKSKECLVGKASITSTGLYNTIALASNACSNDTTALTCTKDIGDSPSCGVVSYVEKVTKTCIGY